MPKHGKLSRNSMMSKARFLITFLAVFVAASLSTATPDPILRPLSAEELDTQIKKSNAKATVVNIWATWCAPCKDEMPELIALRKKLEPKGARLFLVSADSPNDQKEAVAFLKALGVDFPVYRLSQEPDKFMKLFEPHWPAVLPTTMAFDADGKRVGYWIGRVSIKDLEKRIENAWARLASPKKMGSDQKSPGPQQRRHEAPKKNSK